MFACGLGHHWCDEDSSTQRCHLLGTHSLLPRSLQLREGSETSLWLEEQNPLLKVPEFPACPVHGNLSKRTGRYHNGNNSFRSLQCHGPIMEPLRGGSLLDARKQTWKESNLEVGESGPETVCCFHTPASWGCAMRTPSPHFLLLPSDAHGTGSDKGQPHM